MKQKVSICIFMLALSAFCFAKTIGAAQKANIFVSIPPQKFFVEAIGKDLVQTTVIVSPANSPANYEPSPSQMMHMSKADIYFSVGVPFENAWLTKFATVNPRMKIVHTDAGIAKKPVDRYETAGPGHVHGNKGHHHTDGSPDPHIWLSPPLVKIQAGHILEALVSLDPDHRDLYQIHYDHFVMQIDRIDNDLKALFADPSAGKEFLVFHPSWGYFADAYGLKQISIEIEGKSPKAREVKDLIEYAGAHDIRVIFVQPQFSVKQAEIIAKEIHGRLIYADPLAENWIENLRSVAGAIRQAVD